MIASAPKYRNPASLWSDPLALKFLDWATKYDKIGAWLDWVEESGYDRQQVIMERSYDLFHGRSDQPERYDEQQSFIEDRLDGVAWIVGGNGSGTTECALSKAAHFVLDQQPPPARDTAFWIIAPDLTQAAESWAEKLNGHGHIPDAEVDWDRVMWFKPNNNWPFRVPLKPWPGRPGKNWVLEFKSWGQGRHRFQGRAVGGFLFMEQFPHGIFNEVMRGCRQSNMEFAGGRICEFTPIDPNIAPDLEEMINSGPEPEEPLDGVNYLPANDKVYRANTEVAMEAGHVSESWFNDFFSHIPEEQRETRMTGVFADFVGKIYKGFNPSIHLVGDDIMMPGGDFVSGGTHYRTIDWGVTEEGHFACLFVYNVGEVWHVYDEVYCKNEHGQNAIDHLCMVAERHVWPENDSSYGITVADPEDANACITASRFETYRPEYPNFTIQKASKSVLPGITHVQHLLEPKLQITGPNGENVSVPRLYIHKSRCPNLARQLRNYRWKQSSQTGINPEDAQQRPLKKLDHAVDALRYLVYTMAVHSGVTPSAMHQKAKTKNYGIRHNSRRSDNHGINLSQGENGRGDR